jgi:hypothetical protein
MRWWRWAGDDNGYDTLGSGRWDQERGRCGKMMEDQKMGGDQQVI